MRSTLRANPLDSIAPACRHHLSTALLKPLRQHKLVGISCIMDKSRINKAMTRIDAALARIAAARSPDDTPPGAQGAATSARVIELVNAHEKLREEVADALRDLDAMIEQLEE
jgi:hypothetical protein